MLGQQTVLPSKGSGRDLSHPLPLENLCPTTKATVTLSACEALFFHTYVTRRSWWREMLLLLLLLFPPLLSVEKQRGRRATLSLLLALDRVGFQGRPGGSWPSSSSSSS